MNYNNKSVATCIKVIGGGNYSFFAEQSFLCTLRKSRKRDNLLVFRIFQDSNQESLSHSYHHHPDLV
jgi:hypothetical protein